MLADKIQTAITNGVPMLWSVSSTVVIIVIFLFTDELESRSADSGSFRTTENVFDELESLCSN